MINQNNLHLLNTIIDISYEELDRLHQNWPTNIEIWDRVNQKYSSFFKKNPAQIKFCDSYRLISDPCWPDITCVEDFYNLPAHIQQECQKMHNFHPKKWFIKNVSLSDLTPLAEIDSYLLDDVIRAHYIVNRNHDLIQGKRVLDFPCLVGNVALWMSKIDFKYLTLADVRPDSLALADENMRLLNIPDTKWDTIQADLYDLENNTQLCQNFDTLLCSGVLYHIHNHFDVLKSITDSAIENIIIESEENLSIKDSKEAMIWWTTETTDNWPAGWHSGEPTIMIGHPNSRWLDLCMELLGYHRTRPVDFYCQMSALPSGIIRSVHVFKKNA